MFFLVKNLDYRHNKYLKHERTLLDNNLTSLSKCNALNQKEEINFKSQKQIGKNLFQKSINIK